MLIPKELILEAKKKLGEKAAFIIAEDLKLKEFDEKNLKALCPFHDELTPSFVWNPKEDSFKCFGCGRVHGIIDHFISFNNLTFLGAVEKLFKEVDITYRFGEKNVKTERDYKYPEYEENENRDIVNKYCATRKISKETLDYCDVRQDKNGLLMWNFYDLNDVLLTVKCRHPRIIKKGEQKEWFLPNYSNTSILYNMNKIDPTQPLVVTEGQFDTLAIIESGYKNVVSVPSGTENMKWVSECFDWLENFNKIIIWSDNDAPGLQMRKEACARIGNWKCFYIDLPKELEKEDGTTQKVKDANDVLFYFGKDKVLSLIENANEIPITNVVDLYDVNDFDIETAPGLTSGFEQLDKYIYKFILGTVVVFTGRNGSGKSSLLNQMFIAEPLNQGMDVFIYSAEMGKPILKNWVELVLAGPENIKMTNSTVHKIDKTILPTMREWYKNRIFVYDNDKDLSADSILDRLETVIRRFGVKVAILDNLLTIDLGCDQNNLWQEQKKFMVRLVNFANKYNVLIVLISHPRKTAEYRRLTQDDVAGSGDITNLAHYVFGIHRYTKTEKEGEKNSSGNYKKGKEPILYDCVLDIYKNRITGHANKSLELYFNYTAYKFFNKPEELWKRYKWNKDISPLRIDNPNLENKAPDWINGD